jgi:hypothetical protein
MLSGRRITMNPRPLALALSVALACAFPLSAAAPHERFTVRPVSGSGIHDFTTAIVHSAQPTPTGMIQRSTETVDLQGDLVGRLLYQPVSVFDFSQGTLVNTGRQVFSGSILGSRPLMLHDDDFHFEADLNTGAVTGEVHLRDRFAGPRIRCDLNVVGTGVTAEGNALFDYSGECRFRTR